ncbi:MAG: hypothetical protein WBP64_20415 [Nitrososphaeraceae archaeon]
MLEKQKRCALLDLHRAMDRNRTLRELSPRWHCRLQESKNLPFPLSIKWFRWYVEIRNSSKCIVGEAYGYSSSYLNTCGECNKLCVRFMNYFMIHSYSGIEKNANTFVRHWNEKHL